MPDTFTFEEAAPTEAQSKTFSFEEAHPLSEEEIQQGVQASVGTARQALGYLSNIISSPAAAQASQLGRERTEQEVAQRMENLRPSVTQTATAPAVVAERLPAESETVYRADLPAQLLP